MLQRGRDTFHRLLTLLVPREWRETVADDVGREARDLGRGRGWAAIVTARAGLSLRRASIVDALLTDGRHAFRSLARSPGFTTAAVLTFALGIGVNIAVFSIVDRLMFRPLPYHQPERLVHLHTLALSGADPYAVIPSEIAARLRQSSTAFTDMTYADVDTRDTTIDGFGEVAFRFGAAPNTILDVLGVRPVVGAGFTPMTGPAPRRDVEVLLTAETWRARFGGQPDVVGSVLAAGGYRYHVVGVLPAGFLLPSSRLAPRLDGIVAVPDQLRQLTTRTVQMIAGPVARLRDGVSIDQARAEVATLVDAMRAELPAAFRLVRGEGVVVQPLQRGMFFLYGTYLWLLVAAVSLAWLIASVNLATLMLARGRTREVTTAVRSAIGATRGRLLAAGVIETCLLCLASSVVALVICAATQSAVLALAPPVFRGFAVAVFDARLVLVTVAVSIASAVLAGAWPAWRAGRVDVAAVLQRGGRSVQGSRLRGSRTLLAVQALVCVVLVAGAGAMVQSYASLVFSPPGFEPRDLYLFDAGHGTAANETPADRERRVRHVIEELRAIPGVVAVGASSRTLLGNLGLEREFWRARGLTGGAWSVTEDTFRAMGTPFVAGRPFTPGEAIAGDSVVVINEAATRALWPGETAPAVVGRAIDTGTRTRTIVGVVGDIRRRPDEARLPALYLPPGADELERPGSTAKVILRMAPGVAPDTDLINTRLNARFDDRRTLRIDAAIDIAAPWLDRPRFQAVLLGMLAVVALVLAFVGLHAVAAFEVARRRFEMGVRLALGATTRDVRRAVIVSAITPVLIGATAGLVATWWTASFVQSLVFEVDARSPWLFAGVAMTLVSTAVLATWIPARRAARTDPAAVLRG